MTWMGESGGSGWGVCGWVRELGWVARLWWEVVLGELVCVWGVEAGRLPVQVTAQRAGHPSHNASSP